MQLTCPNCGDPIAAENINIQQMAAVCSSCHTVFAFDLPAAKAKRRKVKQPRQMILREDDTLHMAFRTNFRLDKNEDFLTTGFLSVFFTAIALIIYSEYVKGDIPLLIPAIFGVGLLVLYYRLALILFNKTHIDMDEDTIQVVRQPLPGFFNTAQQVDLAGVVAIRCEETHKSKKEAYDTPRYAIWAEMVDGNRKLIVNDLIDDYAFYITQLLHERLDSDADSDMAHLIDDEQEIIDDLPATEGEESRLLDTNEQI